MNAITNLAPAETMLDRWHDPGRVCGFERDCVRRGDGGTWRVSSCLRGRGNVEMVKRVVVGVGLREMRCGVVVSSWMSDT